MSIPLEAWSKFPKINELSLSDVIMRRNPSQLVKNQEIPMIDVVNFIAEFGMHTGVRQGLQVSQNVDTTKFDVAAGTAIIVNLEPNPLNPSVTRIVFQVPTVAILDAFLSDPFTFVFINNVGTIIQRNVRFSSLDDVFGIVFIGQLRHFASTINAAIDNPIIAQGSSSSHISELVFGGGVTLEGAEISPAGADLQVDISAGILEQFGQGRSENETTPNEGATTAQTPILATEFFKVFVDGSGNFVIDNSTNLLAPTLFNEDGLGTLQLVQANKFTNIRVFQALDTKAVLFYYGTKAFDSAEDAVSLEEPTFTEHPTTRQISPVAEIGIKQNVIDFVAAITSGDAIIKRVLRRV